MGKEIIVMYNEKQKMEYIEFENTNMDLLTLYFKRISDMERKFNRDIVDMNEDELRETLIALKIRKESNRGQLISLLRGYVDWARLNKKTANDSVIHNISAESIRCIKTVASQMIKNPEQLNEILKETLDYVDYENRSKKCELLFRLLYCGLTIPEIIILKKDALDYNDNTITTLAGNSYIIDEQVSQLWDYCAKMTYIEKRNGKSQNTKNKKSEEFTKYDLLDNDYLFRPIAGNKADTNTLHSINSLDGMVLNVFKEYSPDGSIRVIPSSIRASGLFYKILMMEKENIEITRDIFIEQFKIKNENKPTVNLKVRDLKIDYEDWKQAFWGDNYGESD